MTIDDADLARDDLLPDDPGQGCVPWEDPAEFDDEQLEVLPPYPLDVLPGQTRGIVEAFAASVTASPELAALPCLAVVAASLGPNWVCGTPSYARSAVLWFGAVAPPGCGKSPAARPALAPLMAEDTRLHDERDLAQDEAKSKTKGRRRYLVVTDTTPEALTSALADSEGHGLLAFSDELAQLLGGMAGYSGGRGRAGRAGWLSAWSGEPVRVLRQTSEPLEVDRPHLCVYGGIQPDVLSRVGLGEGDGLMARWLWAVVEPIQGGLGKPIPADVADWWQRIVGAALALEHGDRIPYEDEATVVLDRYVRKSRARAVELGAAGLRLLAGARAKAPEQAVRLTALLHGLDVIENGGPSQPPVPADTVERAIRLTEWHLAHGAVVARLVERRPADRARAVEADDLLAQALRRALRPGESRRASAGQWAKQLGLPGSLESLGHAFKRLAADSRSGLRVLRLPRAQSRGWRVTRSG
ncbi:MAG: DUF3987 domain-containing protein [Planctomycetes bacterium]|nr:DUF3987 domain-containing protein [Planctomycetota bacterium]